MPSYVKTRHLLLRRVSFRLLSALACLLAALVLSLILAKAISSNFKIEFLAVTPFVVFIVGAIGGFVSFQRRLHQMSDEDLLLIADSLVYTLLAPLVGGILAVLLYVIFLSGLLAGDLFPKFSEDPKTNSIGFDSIFQTHSTYQGYAKLIFWCFLAGFSENFVTDILSQFEGQVGSGSSTVQNIPQAPQEDDLNHLTVEEATKSGTRSPDTLDGSQLKSGT